MKDIDIIRQAELQTIQNCISNSDYTKATLIITNELTDFYTVPMRSIILLPNYISEAQAEHYVILFDYINPDLSYFNYLKQLKAKISKNFELQEIDVLAVLEKAYQETEQRFLQRIEAITH